MTKVSVIVPTYTPGDGLDRVIASLDAQTLPQDEFETIFVDDGSPDDTLERLHRLAETRPNVRVTSIPNSGWPSRPRNLGLDMAGGEYVVFMDHDDYLYPNALAQAYDLAARHDADAVNAKEIKTSSRFFSWTTFQSDVVATDGKNPFHLMPMTPHKMYRRQMLLDNGIRFREGDTRVMWEDIYFNIEVFAKSKTLAVLASQPFYKWVVGHGGNSSASYGHDPSEYWRNLELIFEYVRSGILDRDAEDILMAHHYGLRVLNTMLGPSSLKRSDEYYAKVLAIAGEFAERHVPTRIDSRLSKIDQARSALLRSGRVDLLRPLAQADRGISAKPHATEVGWGEDGSLNVTCEATWTDSEGVALRFDRVDGRLLRRLPEDVAAGLPAELLDVTDEVAAADADLSLTSRQDQTSWPVPTDCTVQTPDHPDGGVQVVIRATGRVEPTSALLGNPLNPGVWEVACRSTLIGYAPYPVVSYSGPARPGLIDGRVMTAFGNHRGNLLLDVGHEGRGLLVDTRPDLIGVRSRRVGLRRHRLTIPVSGVATTGRTGMPCLLRFRRGAEVLVAKGELIADDEGTRVECVLDLPAGDYKVRVVDPRDGRVWATTLGLHIGRAGGLKVSRQEAVKAKRVWAAGPETAPAPTR